MQRLFARGLLLSLALNNPAVATAAQPWCGTQSPSATVVATYRATLDSAPTPLAKDLLPIPIALHVITDGKRGKLTQGQINTFINNVNWAYRNTPFSFYIARVDVTKNKNWYNNCNSNARNNVAMKKRLARDNRYHINIYSCNPHDPSVPAGLVVLGLSTFPFQYPNGSYLHGILIHPTAFPGGSVDSPYGLTAAHEIGHYLGLFHTFESHFNASRQACDDPGDFIADTPTQAAPHFACPESVDSCPSLPGSDDVPNFMNYSTDECMEHFTPGQIEVMTVATATYRPTLGR